MVATTFHKQLEKAFRREVALFQREEGARLPPPVIFQALRVAMRKATGHREQLDYSPECPANLTERLTALATHWATRFEAALPCPTPSFVDEKKLAVLVEWLFALQEHRVACLQAMALLLPPELPATSQGRVEQFFPKGSVSPQPLLPVCSGEVRHINVDPSGLKCLVSACVQRRELPAEQAIRTTTATQAQFIEHFPGLERLRRKARYRDAGGDFRFGSFKTDGVAASVFFREQRQRGRRRAAEATVAADPCDEEEVALQEVLARQPRPKLDLNRTRLISVDPGRRDVLYALIDDPLAPVDGQKKYSLPTASFTARTHRQKAAELGKKVQQREVLADGRTLWQANTELPTRRDVFLWDEFLVAYLPIMDALLRVKRRRCLRRSRFNQYLQRDKVIDQVLRELLGGSLAPAARQRAHIAMGSAAKTCCSTGFGHAPVAMSRFMHRLQKVHRVAVTPVDEFRTSKVCHACLQAQLYHLRLRDPETGRRKAHWQLKACPLCRNPGNSGPRVWQRDFNGAANIRTCFLAEARGGLRPEALRRGSAQLSSDPVHFHPHLKGRDTRPSGH